MSTPTKVDGVLGSRGLREHLAWGTAAAARARAALLVAEYRERNTEIVKNPHTDQAWGRAAVRSPDLLAAVRSAIGTAVAVEHTFLVVKWPGRAFEVPWHQDGTDERIELDPARSVSAWLAITDATTSSGCLHVVPGSQRLGYLPYGAEDDHGAERGRAGQSSGFTAQDTTAIPVPAGGAVLMDSRLLHRSGSNTGDGPRIGLNVRYVAPGAARMRDRTSPSLDPISGSGW